MKCEWQTQRRVVAESATTPTPMSPGLSATMTSPLATSIDPWEALSGDAVVDRKQILNYYIEAFVPSVSIATTPSSFYTSLYIPMAFESESMLDAITALSFAQLARRTLDPDRAQRLRHLSLKHERKCHSFVEERTSAAGIPVRDRYQVMGICLLLVGLEALNGTKDTRWLTRLQSARSILTTFYQEHDAINSWEVESLQRHFTYHDAMASLMARVSKTDPKVPGEHDLLPVYISGMPLTIDPLMGISYHLCALVSRIRYVEAVNPAFPHISEAAFKAIERDIQQWRYESPIASPGIDLPVALDLIALAEAYRLAALIHLYRHSERHKVLIPSCASRAMEFIARIPPGSPAESSMLYPIFLAGAELESEASIASCFQRLTEIQMRNRYDNVGMVQKVLQEVWRPVLNGQEKRDWEDVLRDWDWTFSLG